MTKNNLKVVKTAKDKELENKEKRIHLKQQLAGHFIQVEVNVQK